MSAIYLCCDPERLARVREYNLAHDPGSQLNAIESLEVMDTVYLTMLPTSKHIRSLRQRTLLVRCLLPVNGLGGEQVRILGGERISPVKVQWASPADELHALQVPQPERDWLAALPEPDRVLVVRTDRAGDYSPYRLEIIFGNEAQARPHPQFDPRLWAIEFSFKVECPSKLDCHQPLSCPGPPGEAPAISYLAKDYEGFRRLMLDRMSQLLPGWKPRNPADLGVTLVEWLAYVGDHLSYQQDAVATEAYLETCRSRISLRRHARLMDYFISEGCNARTWVQIEVDDDIEGTDQNPTIPMSTRLLTRIPGQPAAIPNFNPLLAQADAVFETRHALESLFAAHNAMPFYTWSDGDCCLPMGATSATLKGHFPRLRLGDVLILEECRSPVTGAKADADPTKRHAVRLTRAQAFRTIPRSGAGKPLVDPIGDTEITEIEWSGADALPFALVLSTSAKGEPSGDSEQDKDGYSVVCGNIVLADHGLTLPEEEDLGLVEASRVRVAALAGEDECQIPEAQVLPPRYRPRLGDKPLTHRCAYDPSLPATRSLHQDPSAALPLDLMIESRADDEEDDKRETWTVRRDLLGSGTIAPDFVPEIESDGCARLRFGDDTHGRRPNVDDRFFANYRVGNGTAGNVGAEAIAHIESSEKAITGARNPLPAQGGADPESAAHVRDRVPVAYRTQERAVTKADWDEVTARDSQIQQAAGQLRWTGSWYTTFVAVDPKGGGPLGEEFVTATRQRLERYRMAGQDLRVEQGRAVSLELELGICVSPGHFRADVLAALLRRFSNRRLSDGTLGAFHPDRFSFGQPVYLSRIYSAAQQVPGVTSVKALTFRRLGTRDYSGITRGRLDFSPFEIPRLDNDPNFPEHGLFRVRLEGGK